jgi:hypothetical protein
MYTLQSNNGRGVYPISDLALVIVTFPGTRFPAAGCYSTHGESRKVLVLAGLGAGYISTIATRLVWPNAR